MREHLSIPIDPEQFLFFFGIFDAAAAMTMPVENPESTPVIQTPDGAVYSFTDRPMNRGMLAAGKEMRAQGLSDDQRFAVLTRLMHFPDVYRHKERLRRFIKPTDEAGAYSVNEVLIKACATAKFILDPNTMKFDINDVERIAGELLDSEEAAEAQKGQS